MPQLTRHIDAPAPVALRCTELPAIEPPLNQEETIRVRLALAELEISPPQTEDLSLPQTSAQELLPLAERIRVNIASLRIETDKGPLTVALSLGIAQTIHHSALELGHNSQPDSVEKLFLRADQALYAAKQAGRNRIVIFTDG